MRPKNDQFKGLYRCSQIYLDNNALLLMTIKWHALITSQVEIDKLTGFNIEIM